MSSSKKQPPVKQTDYQSNENQEPLLSDQHLLNLAKQLGERWEDIFRHGLVAKDGDTKTLGPACLPLAQLQICRKLCPNDPILQAYHALARWRWFCWYVGCPNKQALNALTTVVNAAGLKNLGTEMQSMNAVYSSLEYV